MVPGNRFDHAVSRVCVDFYFKHTQIQTVSNTIIHVDIHVCLLLTDQTMMSDAEICPECGEKAVVNDDYEGVGKVCTECGYVQSAQSLSQAQHEDIGYQNSSKLHSNLVETGKHFHYDRKQIAKGLTKCIKMVKNMCQTVKFSREMCVATEELIKRVYTVKEFVNLYMTTKNLICHCCVYIVGRQFSYIFTIKEFCKMFKIEDTKAFMKRYRSVLKAFDIQLPAQTMKLFLRQHCTVANLGPSMSVIAEQIIDICDKKMTSLQTDRDGVGISALYFAWMTTLSEEEISKSSLATFCEKFNLRFNKYWEKKFLSMRATMIEVAKNLPWAPKKLPKYYAILNMTDILKYQKTLAMQSAIFDSSDEEDNQPICVNYFKTKCTCISSNEAIDSSAEHSGEILGCEQDSNPESSEESRGQKRKATVDSDDCDDGDFPKKFKKVPCNVCPGYRLIINDSEQQEEKALQDIEDNLDEYIRSDNEVQEILKITGK